MGLENGMEKVGSVWRNYVQHEEINGLLSVGKQVQWEKRGQNRGNRCSETNGFILGMVSHGSCLTQFITQSTAVLSSKQDWREWGECSLGYYPHHDLFWGQSYHRGTSPEVHKPILSHHCHPRPPVYTVSSLVWSIGLEKCTRTHIHTHTSV